MLTNCPKKLKLDLFVQNKLADSEQEMIESHLKFCNVCGKIIARYLKEDYKNRNVQNFSEKIFKIKINLKNNNLYLVSTNGNLVENPEPAKQNTFFADIQQTYLRTLLIRKDFNDIELYCRLSTFFDNEISFKIKLINNQVLAPQIDFDNTYSDKTEMDMFVKLLSRKGIIQKSYFEKNKRAVCKWNDQNERFRINMCDIRGEKESYITNYYEFINNEEVQYIDEVFFNIKKENKSFYCFRIESLKSNKIIGEINLDFVNE